MTDPPMIQARHYRPGRTAPVSAVVIHTAECPESRTHAESLAGWIASSTAPSVSWHYMVDVDSVTQSVQDADTAWHAGPANSWSIGIEHAGYASQTAAQWDDETSRAILAQSAKLVARLCQRHAIPSRRLTAQEIREGRRDGICGHVDVTRSLGGTHTDPGPNFPWSEYLAAVRRELAELTEPDRPTGRTGWIPLELHGVRWLVAPVYVAPVAISEAKRIAEDLGCQLPTPELVDAIWQAADLRIDGRAMILAHDNTTASMDSPEAHAKTAAKLEELVGDRSLGVDFELLAGAFKDVVEDHRGVGIYGWHRPDGTVIQPAYFRHVPGWRDYSQGLRLVKRAD